MEKTTFQDQPTPEAAPAIAQLTPTQRLQAQTEKLGQLLLRQAQLRNAVDVLSLEINLRVLTEHVQILTQLIMSLTGGALTDDMVTTMLADRVNSQIQRVESELNAPQIARGIAALKKHN